MRARWLEGEAVNTVSELAELSTRREAILIKLGPWTVEERPDLDRSGYGYKRGMSDEELYRSVRGVWRINKTRAHRYQYAVAVHGDTTLAVWEIDPDQWERRYELPNEQGGLRWQWGMKQRLDGGPVWEEFCGPLGRRIPVLRLDGRRAVFGSGQPIAYWP